MFRGGLIFNYLSSLSESLSSLPDCFLIIMVINLHLTHDTNEATTMAFFEGVIIPNSIA